MKLDIHVECSAKRKNVMRVSQEIIRELAKSIREHGIKEDITGPDNARITAFYLEDMTVSFITDEKTSLYGISFETLGKEFTILPSLELVVQLPASDTEDDVYEIEDPALFKALEDYLRWRVRILKDFTF